MQRRRLMGISRVLLTILAVSLAVRVLPAGAQVAPNPQVAPGVTASVQGDGECLRLRLEPGTASVYIECIPDGDTVTVLDGGQELEGYYWRLVEYAGLTGWVADAFLGPYDGSSAPPGDVPGETPSVDGVGASCTGGSSAIAGFTGLYAGGGISIAVWGGGNTAGMLSHSISHGCELQSAWASANDGTLVGFLSGAPDFVNERWFGMFPNGDVPAGQVLIVRCDPIEGSSIAHLLLDPALLDEPATPQYTAIPEFTADSAVVLDAATGTVLYEEGAHLALAPASLTKILTAVMVIEGADLDAIVQTDVDGREMGDSSLMGLRAGDCFTVRDLLYGLMLSSGNDAALALARYMAGSEEAFVEQMNARARQLGLTSASFTDPHGLGSPWHVISAYDLAMLSRYAMTLPTFREVVGTTTYVANGSRTLTLYNLNTLVGELNGADGLKTGFTEAAGRTIAASATRNGEQFIVVLMNVPNRNADATALLEWAFENFGTAP